jgi:transposase-like protein
VAQHRDAAKQRRWLELIRRWQQSPTTVREFCQRHRVSAASFFSWRRILRERGLLGEPRTSRTATASADARAFVRLATLDAVPAGSPIELVLNHRRLLRVWTGFDADVLLELIRLLEEPAC